MDVNAINPILSAFAEILPQIGFQSVEKKGISLEGSILDSKGVMINIGVMGPLKGVILIGMDLESAKQFASKMMMGMEVATLDSMAQSAISEMGNMVCAHACMKYSETGMKGLDISPPTLLIGGGQLSLAAPKAIHVAFLVDTIEIDIYVGLV